MNSPQIAHHTTPKSTLISINSPTTSVNSQNNLIFIFRRNFAHNTPRNNTAASKEALLLAQRYNTQTPYTSQMATTSKAIRRHEQRGFRGSRRMPFRDRRNLRAKPRRMFQTKSGCPRTARTLESERERSGADRANKHGNKPRQHCRAQSRTSGPL